MKFLLDENVPRTLRKHLHGHELLTLPEMGWSGKKNGELLRLAEATFDGFITFDRGISHQQNIKTLKIVIITIAAHSNTLAEIEPLIPDLQEVLDTLQAGVHRQVGQR